LVEAWTSSIVAAVENGSPKENPLDHKLVRLLLPEHLGEIAELEAKKSELEATIRSAQPSDDEDAQEEENDETLSEAELKGLKKELGAVKKALRARQHGFLEALEDAHMELNEDGGRNLVLRILHNELSAILERYVADHRQQMAAAFEGWSDKYHVTLVHIEEERDAAAARLGGYLETLGYGA
jgi:type I restriction enzyme M protein